MFSVIFEVLPAEGRKDRYLGLAKHLTPILKTIDGFVDNERFESRRRPGWVLSHSTWRDEKSLVRWRTEAEHHATQAKGRADIFSDYHLRVGEVTADTAPPPEAPILERRFDETEVGAAKVMTFTELTPGQGGAAEGSLLPARLGLDVRHRAVVDYDVWASIYHPGKMALLVAWTDASAASGWTPKPPAGIEALRHRSVRVIRDYGRFDRREAPQYYADVEGGKTKHAAPAQRPATG